MCEKIQYYNYNGLTSLLAYSENVPKEDNIIPTLFEIELDRIIATNEEDKMPFESKNFQFTVKKAQTYLINYNYCYQTVVLYSISQYELNADGVNMDSHYLTRQSKVSWDVITSNID
jgi:hypothetical protein